MAVKTNSYQPVVYDMMLLADSLICLSQFVDASRKGDCRRYCEREKNLIVVLTKIRSFAEFLNTKKNNGLLHVKDREFEGNTDSQFIKKYDRISKYVSHLSVQRWKKEAKYKQPKATEALKDGKKILGQLRIIMNTHMDAIKGDAARWYRVFECRYKELMEGER